MAEGGGTGYRLGVDLGTTFTAAAVERDGQIRMVPLGLRQPEVGFPCNRGGFLIGVAASRLVAS